MLCTTEHAKTNVCSQTCSRITKCTNVTIYGHKHNLDFQTSSSVRRLVGLVLGCTRFPCAIRASVSQTIAVSGSVSAFNRVHPADILNFQLDGSPPTSEVNLSRLPLRIMVTELMEKLLDDCRWNVASALWEPEHVVFFLFLKTSWFSVSGFRFCTDFHYGPFAVWFASFVSCALDFLRVFCFPVCFSCRFPKFLWIVSISIVGFSFSTQACNCFRMLDFSCSFLGKLPFKFSVPSISLLLAPRIVEIFAKCWRASRVLAAEHDNATKIPVSNLNALLHCKLSDLETKIKADGKSLSSEPLSCSCCAVVAVLFDI